MARILRIVSSVAPALLGTLFSAPVRGGDECGMGWAPSGEGLNGAVRALCVSGVDGDAALYAGGLFSASGGTPLANVARWNGLAWSGLGTGLLGEVFALAPESSEQGGALIVGGAFTGAVDGTPGTAYIARWDGFSWSSVGGGLDGPVRVLERATIGGETALYAGGFFTKADGAPARRIARWDGAAWQPLGSGLNGGAHAIVEWNGALYVGGSFTDAGGVAAANIARWDGAQWSVLTPAGVSGGEGIVRALAVFEHAGAERLVAAGAFTSAGGGPALNIARWDGTSWAPLGGGTDGPIHALAVFGEGAERSLFAAGAFAMAGGAPAASIARWSGQEWSVLDAGLDGLAWALRPFDESASGRAPALHVGGAFRRAGDVDALHIARWGAFGCVGPVIVQQPSDVAAPPDGRAEFRVMVAGSEPLTFHWRFEGANLSDGGPYSGAHTPSLRVEPVNVLVEGAYDVVVSGPGGSVTSHQATLTVGPACPGDASGDGRVNFIDITAVMVDWGAVYLPIHGTGSGDANGDGVVNFADITTVLAEWGRDCAPH